MKSLNHEGHEGREEHEEDPFSVRRMRLHRHCHQTPNA